ncbi:MAG: hypothetical protein RL095_2680 [Verrucomicrobiota bacterium]|jgi:flagellar basal body-associated protein FliL
MAEDPKKAEAPSDIEVKKSQEGKLILVVAILAILVIVLTPAVTLFWLKSYNPVEKQAAVATKEEGEEKPRYEEVKLAPLKCNISGTKGTRFLMFQVTIKVTPAPDDPNKTSMAYLFTPKKSDDTSKKINLVGQTNAKLLEIMSNLTLDELDAPNARGRTAVLIAKALNELKNKEAPKVEGDIKEAYFEDFFIQ